VSKAELEMKGVATVSTHCRPPKQNTHLHTWRPWREGNQKREKRKKEKRTEKTELWI